MKTCRNHLKIGIALFIIAVLIIALASPSLAASDIKVLINGQERQFTPEPVTEDGSTLVPMRAFFEALGCEVKWDGAAQTATGIRDGITVRIPIGKKTAYVNDQAKQLTVAAQLINGSTFIPLRFVGEALGDQVGWDGKTRVITITSPKAAKIVTVHFIDVGQADSIYIQAPGNYDILIDAGNNDDGPTVVDYLKRQKVDDIEIMVATHAHEDHIGGLDDVLAAFDVEKIIDSGEVGTTKTYRDYWSAVQAEGAEYLEDDDLVFELGPGIKFFIIETGDGYKNTNNNSVLAKLDYNNIEFLFTGDMETDAESMVLTKDIQADILKVGHHGSRSSTSEEFLSKVNPSAAVICVGEGNTYGHPHKETLTLLSRYGIDVFMTKSGDIICTTDGDTYSFNLAPVLLDA
jgi:competence protein ComEC